MRFLRGLAWIIGAVALGTGGLLLGAALWRQGIGPVLACFFIAAAVCMADKGMETW